MKRNHNLKILSTLALPRSQISPVCKSRQAGLATTFLEEMCVWEAPSMEQAATASRQQKQILQPLGCPGGAEHTQDTPAFKIIAEACLESRAGQTGMHTQASLQPQVWTRQASCAMITPCAVSPPFLPKKVSATDKLNSFLKGQC